MAQRVEEAELRRRAGASVAAEIEAFGASSTGAAVFRAEGVTAAIVPAAPERSLFNAVHYEAGGALAACLDRLDELYREAGVTAWTVWVPEDDRETAALLERRGHALDGSPRAMAIDLDSLGPMPPAPSGHELGAADPGVAGQLNDAAYEHAGFTEAVGGGGPIRWRVAHSGPRPVACVGWLDAGDDRLLTGVATHPEARRRGLAGWLVGSLLEDAAAAGMATATLRASAAGAPLYARLGFADLGCLELWELRR